MVELQSLWAKQTAVVVFLRRFGWQLCRLWSTELSSVKSQLDAHNVRLCGVGLEELGLEEFVEKKFFTGGLEKKNCWTFWMIHAFLLIRTYDLLHGRCINDVTIDNILLFYHIKQIDSLLQWVCSVIDHKRLWLEHQWHLAALCLPFFLLFSPHSDVICNLLLNRCTATWNLYGFFAKKSVKLNRHDDSFSVCHVGVVVTQSSRQRLV